MAWQTKFLCAMFLIGITGLYATITFGLLAALSDELSNHMVVLMIGVVVLHVFLSAFQLLQGMRIEESSRILGMLCVLGAIGSDLVMLSSVTVLILGIAVSNEVALGAIDIVRTAGVVGVGVLVIFGLNAIGASITCDVNKAMRELDDEPPHS